MALFVTTCVELDKYDLINVAKTEKLLILVSFLSKFAKILNNRKYTSISDVV